MNECTTCGVIAQEIQTHHIVPRSRGGTEHPGNVIRVCLDCHSLIHDKRITGSELIRDGIAAARERGVPIGKPRLLTADVSSQVIAMHQSGVSSRTIAKAVGVSHSTICRTLQRA